MELAISVKKLEKNEDIKKAINLVWRVFQEYDASDYSEEGINEFYKSIHDTNFISQLNWYGAFNQDELIGIIATRDNGKHISLFFVDRKYQRQGIGKRLFRTVRIEKMTVNSSPYAVPIYHKLCFKETDSEQIVNGLRYIPMILS